MTSFSPLMSSSFFPGCFFARPPVACFAAALALMIVAPRALATGPAVEYSLREWHVSDGLPDEVVHEVVQDSQGYLWVATESGIARFNGLRFDSYSPPEHPGFNIASGDEQSDGFEAGVIGRPWRNWRVVGSYAYTDARVTKDPTRPQNVGSRASNKPHNQASLWNRYNWSGGFLKGFNIGVGVTCVDERRGNPNLADLPGLQLPDYTRVDVALGYATRILGNPASVTMNISNLFDELYYQNYDGYGPPFNANVTVRFRF
jgi:hypothetical protein